MVDAGAVVGLRWGECVGPDVGDLDLLARTVSIAGQRTRSTGGRMVEAVPKSLAGRRISTMPQPLVDRPAAHLTWRRLTGADAHEDVFVGPRSRPLK